MVMSAMSASITRCSVEMAPQSRSAAEARSSPVTISVQAAVSSVNAADSCSVGGDNAIVFGVEQVGPGDAAAADAVDATDVIGVQVVAKWWRGRARRPVRMIDARHRARASAGAAVAAAPPAWAATPPAWAATPPAWAATPPPRDPLPLSARTRAGRDCAAARIQDVAAGDTSSAARCDSPTASIVAADGPRGC